MKYLYDFVSKSQFPKVELVQNELQKLGILRWGLGFLIFVRFYEIVNSLQFLNQDLPTLAYVTLGLIVLFTIGFSVPIVTLGLMLAIRMLDAYASTNTLGTTILMNLLLLMLMSNAGQYYSLDSILVKLKGRVSKIYNLQYAIIGKHSEQSLTLVYFFIFFLYALISFAALGYHIQDKYWVYALTIKSLLSNSYLSSGYYVFREIENTYPITVSVLSIIGVIGQSLFQFFMFFLMFTKWGRIFVKWWGLKFFVISLFLINLSYLPHIEIILWIILFFPIQKDIEKVKIIYDDYCNLCKKAMLFFKRYNFNNKYEFIALSKNRDLYESNNLTEKEVKTYMVGWYKGQLYKGYDLYFKLLLLNPLFYILIPFFVLGYFTRLGKPIYNYIAERRYRVFGQCELSFEDEIQENNTDHFSSYKPVVIKLILGYYLLIIISFVILHFPFVKDVLSPKVPDRIKYPLKSLIYNSGIEVPVVFNENDLSMGNKWMVMYRRVKGNDWEIVPISAEDGHRMSYNGYDIMHFTNHNSDLLYFGTSLSYRRTLLSVTDYETFHTEGLGKSSIEKKVKYDYQKKYLLGVVEYKIKVYQCNSSNVVHWVATPERHDKKLKYQASYTYDGKDLIKYK